jgi:hypothetical protein
MLPIEVLPVSAVYAPTPPPKPAIQKSRHPGTDADLPMPTTSGEPFDPVASLPRADRASVGQRGEPYCARPSASYIPIWRIS